MQSPKLSCEKWTRGCKWQISGNDNVLLLPLRYGITDHYTTYRSTIFSSGHFCFQECDSSSVPYVWVFPLSKPPQPTHNKPLPTMRMVCQPRQDRSGTWCRDPKIGRGHEVQISEPCGLSVGVIARRPLPPLPQAKMWLSRKKIKQQIV